MITTTLSRLIQGAFVATMLFATGAQASEPQAVVENFDGSRYMGTWYEIARFRELAEVGCYNSKATYTALNNGRVHVLNECDRLGGHSTFQAELYAPNPEEPARCVLEAKTAGITRHVAYNVLAVDENYGWAMVGEPDFSSLWILSRTPFLNTDVLTKLAQHAEAIGYHDVDKRLHCTSQPNDANESCKDVMK